MFEEQRRNQKYPLHKQGSKSMGEKIANPDYVDPQKLFLGSRNCSQIDLTDGKKPDGGDILGEPEPLDLTINESEVLSEIEKRLKGHNLDFNLNSSTEISLNSSQNSSDSYYECILDSSLTEEFVKDSSGKLVAKQDSFSSNESTKTLLIEKYKNLHDKKSPVRRAIVKRPNKAPPPIPAKPSRLTSKAVTVSRSVTSTSTNHNDVNANTSTSTTSWVKTMVGRFEWYLQNV